jgi:hypothetical protein
MASDVRVTLSGSETISGAAHTASEAIGGLKENAMALLGLNAVIDIFDQLSEAFQKVKEFVDECTKAYAEDQKAELSLSAAVEMSPLMTGSAKEQLVAYAEQVARLTGLTVAQVESMESELVVSGRNMDQTKELIAAASGLSVAMGVDVKTAMEQLNETYSGQVGRLTRLFPEIKNYTKAQLEAGAAVDYVAGRVRDQSDALSGSADVSLKNYKNAWEDLKATIGGILNESIQPFRDAITQIVQYLVNHKDVVQGILNGIALSFSAILLTINPILGGIALVVTGLNMLQQSVGGWKILWFDTEKIALLVFKAILDSFSSMVNSVTDGLNLILSGYNKVASLVHAHPIQLLAETDFSKALGVTDLIDSLDRKIAAARQANAEPSVEPKLGSVQEPAGASGGRHGKYIEGGIGGPSIESRDEAYAAKLAEKEAAEKQKAQDEARKLTNDLRDSIMKAIDQMRLTDAKRAKETHDDNVMGKNGAGKAFSTRWSDDMGRTEAGAIAGTTGNAMGASGGLGSLLQVVSQVVGGFAPFLLSLRSVTAILNPFQTIFQGIVDVLGPLVNTILQPIVGILTIIGNTLGKMLAPLISTILVPITTLLTSAFIWLYNFAIMPFGNAVIFVFNALYDGVAFIWNAIANAINSVLGWLGVHVGTMATRSLDSGMLTAIDASSLSAAGASTTGSGGGAGATYQQSQPLNMYFNVQTDVMVGNGGFDDFIRMVSLRMNQLGIVKAV